MVLMRAPLGAARLVGARRSLNAAQCIGWSIFELLIIATAVAALSDELFGFRAQWLWTLVFGGVALALALLGPIDFVRKFVRKVAVWAVLASLLYLTWWALDGSGFGGLWDRGGEGGSSVLEGVDLVVAITVSWIPLAADYTRFSRTRVAARSGARASATSWRASGSGRSAPSSSSRATSPMRRRCRSRSRPGASAPCSRCSR